MRNRSQRRGSRDYSDSDPDDDQYVNKKSNRNIAHRNTSNHFQNSSGEDDDNRNRRRDAHQPKISTNNKYNPPASSSSRSQHPRTTVTEDDSGDFESHLQPGNFGDKTTDSIYLTKQTTNADNSPTNAGAPVRVVSRARNTTSRPGIVSSSSNGVRPTGSFVPKSTASTTNANNSRNNNYMAPNQDLDFEEEVIREDSRGHKPSQQHHQRSSREREETADDREHNHRTSREQQFQSSSRSKPLEDSWTKSPTVKKFLTDQEEEEAAMSRASKSSWKETNRNQNVKHSRDHLEQPQNHVKKTFSKYSTMNNKSDIETFSGDDETFLEDDNKYRPQNRPSNKNNRQSTDDFSIEGEEEEEEEEEVSKQNKIIRRKDHGDFEEEQELISGMKMQNGGMGRDKQHVSYSNYSQKKTNEGVTLLRKSGRYSDEEDNNPSEKMAISKINNNTGTGGWVTGQQQSVAPRHAMSHLAPATFSTSSRNSFVLVAHPRGLRTQHVQCTIIRDRSSIHGKLYPAYELILEEPRKTLIVAQKMSMNRTSNYHLFDMTRGQAGSKLSKKSGNYLGKLRAKNSNRTGYALMNHKFDREEVAGILFDRVTMIDQIKEGNQPRRMNVLTPPIDEEGVSQPVSIGSLGVESLTDLLVCIEENTRTIPEDFVLMHTKDPVFENGNYRLNFHGRVSMPSVKNFQMVSDDNIEDIKCQFGKVDKDVFHLDYKAPFNALQAFALALCQFNL